MLSINVPYMGCIACLPKEVFNSLRSSIVLSDLAQVVDELICNSVDAGASKVQAFVDVQASYIKVEDDGCGIKRDDLTLLGERHATSKLHTLAELNAGIQTLGFRGEALSSLSDVALLEVSTRARGSPNSYRKIIKGSKCLSVGLDGSKQSPGTTVIAHDIFYNQPVRRRQLQSSPRKVLQSIRERVLRIALIQPQVAYTVTDVDREEELIHTLPATSPLCILRSIFGNELSNGLCEINFAKGKLKLSGFLSGPTHRLSSKAVQFFYVNSRFVHKTPVHKLLNSLTTRIESISTPSDGDSLELKGGKKKVCKDFSERHLYPAYVLNLVCPHSSYDITSELSKTVVEFKDWTAVISFVEKALQHIWGELSAHSLQGDAKSAPRKHKIWQHIDPTYHPSCKVEVSRPSKEDSAFSAQEQCYKRRRRKDSEEAFRDIAHVAKYRRNEDTLLSGSRFQNMPKIGCDTLQCQLQEMDGCIAINSFPEQMNRFRLGKVDVRESRQDKANNEILGIEWANPAPGIELEVLNEREPLMSELIPDLFYFDGKEAQSSSLPYFMHSKHSPLRKKSNAALSLATNCKKPVSREVHSFEWENGESGTFLEEYHLGKLDSGRDNTSLWPKHTSTVRVSHTTLSPVISDESPASSKLDSIKCKNGEISTYAEKDWPGNLDLPDATMWTEESLEDNDLISEGIYQRMDAYPSRLPELCALSSLEHSNPNDGGHSKRDESVSLNHEPGSYPFMGKSEQKARKIDKTYFSTKLNNLCKDSGQKLCLEDTYRSQQSKFRTDDEEVGQPIGRQTKYQMYCMQPDVYLPRHVRHVDSTGYWIDHPYQTELGEMSPTVVHNGQSQAYGKADSLSRQNTELESKIFCNVPPKANSRRSLSAPPFYRQHRKFGLHINPPCSLSTEKRKDKQYYSSKMPGSLVPQNNVEDFLQIVPASETFQASHIQNGLQPFLRDCQESNQLHRDIHKETQIMGGFEHSDSLLLLDNLNSLEENEFSLSKWVTDVVPPISLPESITESQVDLPIANRFRDWKNSRIRLDSGDDILDISSGPLYSANGSLVPESIDKHSFMKARVLQQVGKKFIAVVAQGNLALIDQHAADERIRLEQLRNEVLEGEGRQKITHLEHEEELVLPVGGLQLLQNYNEQIENWGWHCKILSRNERSLERKEYQLHRRTCKAFLSAVPCILGVNLTAKDLYEYLEQLAQTDGSSAAPPAVLRILSYKACRGAIMFGDSLLLSECTQLVEELKKTALCFQCAHGRPTTVPLVNLEALHSQLAKFEEVSQDSQRISDRSKSLTGNTTGNPTECWHGLQRHRATLERAKMRLH